MAIGSWAQWGEFQRADSTVAIAGTLGSKLGSNPIAIANEADREYDRTTGTNRTVQHEWTNNRLGTAGGE